MLVPAWATARAASCRHRLGLFTRAESMAVRGEMARRISASLRGRIGERQRHCDGSRDDRPEYGAAVLWSAVMRERCK